MSMLISAKTEIFLGEWASGRATRCQRVGRLESHTSLHLGKTLTKITKCSILIL